MITGKDYRRLDFEIADIEIRCFHINGEFLRILATFTVNTEKAFTPFWIDKAVLDDTLFDWNKFVKRKCTVTGERLLLEKYGGQ